MALSRKKQAKVERAVRVRQVRERSILKSGTFLDAWHDEDARLYIATGDPEALERLPDYRKLGDK